MEYECAKQVQTFRLESLQEHPSHKREPKEEKDHCGWIAFVTHVERNLNPLATFFGSVIKPKKYGPQVSWSFLLRLVHSGRL